MLHDLITTAGVTIFHSTGVSPGNNLIDGCRRRNNLAESCGNVNVKQRKRDWQTGRLCSEKGPSNISCAGCCSAGPCVPKPPWGVARELELARERRQANSTHHRPC